MSDEIGRQIGTGTECTTDTESFPSLGNPKPRYSWGYTLQVRVLPHSLINRINNMKNKEQAAEHYAHNNFNMHDLNRIVENDKKWN